jgi:hypothetical protein
MDTSAAADYHPCTTLLIIVGFIAFIGMLGWAFWKRRGVIGRRDGQITYGLTLEWPIAFSTVIIGVCTHMLLSHKEAYLYLLRKNGEPLRDFGAFLFITLGGFAFSTVRENRTLRTLCLVAASIGVCLICSTIECLP